RAGGLRRPRRAGQHPRAPLRRAQRALRRGGRAHRRGLSMEPAPPRTPSFRLDGRRALVTGAGRGIGLAAAAALAEAGAHVTLCARSRNEIEEAAGAIRKGGGSAEAMVLDVGDTAAVRAALAARP